MRIAIDIDSTLHHHWDLLSAAARRRFGVELPYGEQVTYGSTRLRQCQMDVCVHETQTDEAILSATPYPGAVEAVRAWHDAGHFVLVATYRPGGCTVATRTWLERIGLAHDELRCTEDKLATCRELAIDLVVDDAPDVLRAVVDAGLAAATIAHPWNEDVVAEEDVVAAPDWPALVARLEAAHPALRAGSGAPA
jgi:uncharacterized protein